jgi:polysaccharide pyruvyl transferase WcaK-like protein
MRMDCEFEFRTAADPERTMFGHLDEFVAASAAAPRPAWKPDRPLRMLLAGYIGAGNVGADMRSIETIRQLRHLLGGGDVSFTTILNGPHVPGNLESQASLATIDGYIPRSVVELARSHDAVVACEGSMLKSSFSNVLSGIMAGALAVSGCAGRLAVGYGAEVAWMEPVLEAFVRRWLPSSLLLCRNKESLVAANRLDLRAALGADTAWTCQAASPEQARSRLSALGYDADKQILAVCPVNPFWWPVRPNPRRVDVAPKSTAAGSLRYADGFFHTYDDVRAKQYAEYIKGLARAVNVISKEQRLEPLVVAMEPIDAAACNDLNALLERPGRIISGHEHSIGIVVAILREADLLISSRFHALVAAAPGGRPLIGIATDERIVNLLSSCGAQGTLIAADETELAARIISAARAVDREEFRQAMQRLVSTEIVRCGHMGIQFVDEVRRCIPDFPLSPRAREWEAHLPPLPRQIQKLLAA